MKKFFWIIGFLSAAGFEMLFADGKPKPRRDSPGDDEESTTFVVALDMNSVKVGIRDRTTRGSIALRNNFLGDFFSASVGAMGPLDMISDNVGFRLMGESYQGHISSYGSGYSSTGYGEVDMRYTYAAAALYSASDARNKQNGTWVWGGALGVGYVNMEGKFRTAGEHDSNVYFLNLDKTISEQALARRNYLIASGGLKAMKDDPVLQYLYLRMHQGNNLEILGQYMVARGSALPDRIGLDYLQLPRAQQPSLAQYIALTQSPGAKRIRFAAVAPAAFLFMEIRVPYGMVFWTIGGPFFTADKVQYDFLQNFRFGYRIRFFDTAWIGNMKK